jgi:DNA-binding NarL/FixJ family response regulator
MKALHLIAAGGIFIPNSILLQILKEQGSDENEYSDTAKLLELADFTPRQLEVLRLLWKGKSNKIIAYELKMQESTVKVHVRDIMRKLKATNRTHAAFLASRLLETKEEKV